jgi:hypothetical protein
VNGARQHSFKFERTDNVMVNEKGIVRVADVATPMSGIQANAVKGR